ncbi:PLP-dependent aminotransferase family protein [Pedobacter antarcticus]|uniref:aminotransferase-like domain-containing protein n=1 Tax=Pedobacter antarcticus TaxID=34086 RepID=UPI001C595EC1|nr:PLP-dependent aminotransferase family protein [Pedobacter antarcticus]
MFSYQHIISLEKKSRIPVYRQIAISIINAIRNGILKPGTHLPSSRELAKTLYIHRKTVIAAYEELNTQDWIVIIPRKHAAVSERIPLLKPQMWNEETITSSYGHELQLPFDIVNKNINEETIATTFDVIIDDGYPDVRLSPIDELLKTYRSLTYRKYGIKNANNGTTQGTLKLRDELVNYLSETRGLNISAKNILITHGAQMSIYLSANLLLNSASNVIVGKPNYPVANMAFERTGAKIIEVDVDQDGINTDAIEAICKKLKINAVYVIPHHHYPTTVTLSTARRMKLLELSKQFSFAIIEDDYDYDYHYTSSPYLPLASANHSGNIIYIGSFSKILDPSIRIGFMVAPVNFITQCTALRKMIDFGGDGYMQNSLATLIKEGELKRHLKKAKKCYHSRRNFLDGLLKEHLAKYVSYTLPSGGMAIWIKLNSDLPVASMSKYNLRINRIDTTQNAFRFGFASLDEKELELTVKVLKENILDIEHTL